MRRSAEAEKKGVHHEREKQLRSYNNPCASSVVRGNQKAVRRNWGQPEWDNVAPDLHGNESVPRHKLYHDYSKVMFCNIYVATSPSTNRRIWLLIDRPSDLAILRISSYTPSSMRKLKTIVFPVFGSVYPLKTPFSSVVYGIEKPPSN